MKRYKKLLHIIDIFQPNVIIETGTWNGDNACRMLKVAHQYHERPVYVGFDLFEEASDQTDAEEFNVKPHFSIQTVETKIKERCPYADVVLFRGNTRETLKKDQKIVDYYKMAEDDSVALVFIDGGHSLETIEHDYECLKSGDIIVFDDYYVEDEQGRIPNLEEMGCNKLLEGLPHAVIHTGDWVMGGGLVNFAVKIGNEAQ